MELIKVRAAKDQERTLEWMQAGKINGGKRGWINGLVRKDRNRL